MPRLHLEYRKDGGGNLSPLYATTDESGIARVLMKAGTTIPNNSMDIFNIAAGLNNTFQFLGVP